MPSMFHGRGPRLSIILGLVFFMIACVFPTKDRFYMTINGEVSVITRNEDPLIYWGTESAILLIAVSFSAYGLYRDRKGIS